MTKQQNTRPSASREIAVKKLEWVKDPKKVSFVDAEYVDTFGLYSIAECVLFIGHTETGIRFDTVKEAKAAAQADYERRILSAIDTTHGNTDPIAKYDGWREDVDTDFIYPPIPDRSHDWYARFKWHDGDTDLRGHGETELDAVFDLFRNALDYEYGDGSEQESILDAAWIGIGGSHPTEQLAPPDWDDELRKVQGGWRGVPISTFERLPEKPGKRSYEHVRCLIFIKGEWEVGMWNCEHLVWDDDEGDDFRYHPTEPTHWMPLPPPPTEHPTEQPSVRDAALLKRLAAHLALNAHINGATSDRAIAHNVGVDSAIAEILKVARGESALRSLAQEGE